MRIRARHQRNVLRRTVVVLALPLVLMATAHAVFSQQVGINADASNVAYSKANNLLFTYNWTTSLQGQNTTYSYNPATVKNNGATSVANWRVVVTLPAGYTNLTCQATVTCTTVGTILTISPQASIATITAGASVNFTFSYISSNPKYTLQDVAVSAQAAASFQTLSGLTVGFTQGPRQGTNQTGFYWVFTFTVTNNSGQALQAWRITTNWATGNRVVAMPANISYTTSSTQLVMTSTQPLASGSNYQYNASLGPASGGSYNLTGVTVQGMP